jgi:aspartate-semialdehyde dehydrogenase
VSRTNIEIKNNSGRGVNVACIIITLLLSVVAFMYYNKSQKAAETIQDLSGNVYALKNAVQQYQVRLNDSTRVNVARVRQLAVSLDTWKQLYTEEVKAVKHLKSRLSNIENITTTSTVSADTVRVPVIRNIKQEQTLDYYSKWIDIKAVIDTSGRTAQLQYEKRDSLILIHLVERKTALWGLIRFGKKAEYYEGFSLDPKTKIQSLTVKKIID